jgi:hypothetical protein
VAGPHARGDGALDADARLPFQTGDAPGRIGKIKPLFTQSHPPAAPLPPATHPPVPPSSSPAPPPRHGFSTARRAPDVPPGCPPAGARAGARPALERPGLPAPRGPSPDRPPPPRGTDSNAMRALSD